MWITPKYGDFLDTLLNSISASISYSRAIILAGASPKARGLDKKKATLWDGSDHILFPCIIGVWVQTWQHCLTDYMTPCNSFLSNKFYWLTWGSADRREWVFCSLSQQAELYCLHFKRPEANRVKVEFDQMLFSSKNNGLGRAEQSCCFSSTDSLTFNLPVLLVAGGWGGLSWILLPLCVKHPAVRHIKSNSTFLFLFLFPPSTFFLTHDHYQGYSELLITFVCVYALRDKLQNQSHAIISFLCNCLVCVIAFHACQVQRAVRASCFSSIYFIKMQVHSGKDTHVHTRSPTHIHLHMYALTWLCIFPQM